MRKRCQLINVDVECRCSVRGSHQRYLQSLNAKKEDSVIEEQRKKLRENIEDLIKKKKQCENEVKSWTTTAGELAEKAESEHSLLLVTQSNALRKRVREKHLSLIDDEFDIKKKRMRKLWNVSLHTLSLCK